MLISATGPFRADINGMVQSLFGQTFERRVISAVA
jgi:hypothetical protein